MSGESSVDRWSASDLENRLLAGEDVFVFDVRNEDEFDAWRIEGRGPLETVNVPYYEMLEVDEFDDVVDTFEDFLKREWDDKLPTDRVVLAVCAKGDTSEYVARAMRRRGLQAVNLEGGTLTWGNHYSAHAIDAGESISIVQVARPARGCLSYIVACGHEAVVIDPLRHHQRYVALCEQAGTEIIAVIDTHGHADHISGGPALAVEVGTGYYLHPYDGIHPMDVLPAKIPFEFIEDGLEFSVGSASLKAFHIPGHTLGNLAFVLDEQFLFSGDSIFIESISRPDLGGRAETWVELHYESLRRLMNLPDEVQVLPGHFNSLAECDSEGRVVAALGELKRSNAGLVQASGSKEDFADYILGSLPEFPPQYVEIKRVNVGLAVPGEVEASELEIGKNVCAVAD